MGQRLNIEITDGEKGYANAYYHWSGYTESSLELAKQIIDSISHCKYEKVTRAIGIAILEVTGAAITDEEYDICKIGTRLNSADRNNGLIAVSEA